MHESLNILLDLVLPEGVKSFFELKSHKADADNLHLYLEELNNIPEEFTGQKLESKGFFNEVTLQDYPIRGRNVFLHVKRRRWLNHTTGKVVFRDWELVAKGTRITKDFAAFLKEIRRYTGS
jgi:transposase